MTTYENALIAMERLLRRSGFGHWADWMLVDLSEWQEKRSVAHHLSAYSGMGSLNDVVIYAFHGNVNHVQEPWAQALFEYLKELLFYLSSNPDASVAADQLIPILGRDASSFSAFWGAANAKRAMNRIPARTRLLQGWRCDRCGHTRLTSQDVDRFIGDETVPNIIAQAAEEQTLELAVDQVLALNMPLLEELRAQLRAAATASHVELAENNEWLRTCPKCQSDKVAIARWGVRLEPEPHLKPLSDEPPNETNNPAPQPRDHISRKSKPWWKPW